MDKVEQAVAALLECLDGSCHDNPDLAETPRRVAKYLLSHFNLDNEISSVIEDCRRAVFPNNYTGIVSMKGIKAYGICPHHLLPVFYTAAVAYIPANNQVIGLSKLVRIVEVYARKAITQEDLTVELAMIFQEILKTGDVAVIVNGVHTCMVARGVKNEAEVTTAELRGSFLDDAKTRQEFYSIIK